MCGVVEHTCSQQSGGGAQIRLLLFRDGGNNRLPTIGLCNLGRVTEFPLVRFMRTISTYRALLLVRTAWLLVEWYFGWDARRHVTWFTLLPSYASPVAHAAAEIALLIILASLWFFRPWARSIFVLVLVLSVVDAALWPYRGLSLSPSFAVALGWCVVMLNGVIVALSFLPPVRNVFGNRA